MGSSLTARKNHPISNQCGMFSVRWGPKYKVRLTRAAATLFWLVSVALSPCLACAAEWMQAELDSKLAALLVRPSAAIPRFSHTWIYPPDGSDVPSLGNKGWWQGLAGPGVIMSYVDAQPNKLDQSVCSSGSASRQKISEMENLDLAVGPIFSKTHGWICD